MVRRFAFALLAGSLALAACGGSGGSGAVPPTTAVHGTDATGVVWLCRPGLARDPCAGSLDSTSVAATGARRVIVTTPRPQPFDCFYVYPTVSNAPGTNAPVAVTPAETAVAVAQAERFSAVCTVWAPVYAQRTSGSLAQGFGAAHRANAAADASVTTAFEDFLHHDAHGRPFVLIGHSQGAAMVIDVIRHLIERSPSLRRQLLLAVIAGGNVAVPTGATIGSTFTSIPLCTASGQDGCVIAWSSFGARPPGDASFGRPGQGVSLQSSQTATTASGVQVACVNPADLPTSGARHPAGRTSPSPLDPYFPVTAGTPPGGTRPTTPWVTYPDHYTASCRTTSGATWLQVDNLTPAAAKRPAVSDALGPQWGYHLVDVNLVLGNLVTDTAAAEASWLSSHPAP